ncbi:hypothetical protein HG535_0G03610 [Zygotorulaspora mrakii]|uniref:Transcriptional repressor OPI1 n=1 Tax=Zygotorulaspora mrakii TaxID=42260 RepID=A0A7H9B6X8_ZYGMR|nr:uncharacterized protein HG535_0G03610 [Zygotorulaspora mrakii]QLG74478.1 hypothetical protein HG535_0G03610 [Zygotorulaspora mrakii]
MPLRQHPSLSEEDVQAAEMLDVLRNSHADEHVLSKELENKKEVIKKEDPGLNSQALQGSQYSLLEKVRRNSIINNVVTLYEMNSKKRAASILLEKERGPSRESFNDIPKSDEPNYDLGSDNVSKRQKITKALAKSKGNLKEYQLNMSIESKKRLMACLHLLKLANKQLTNRVSVLQTQVEKERKDKKFLKRGKPVSHPPRNIHDKEECGSDISNDSDDDSDEEFFDASDSLDDQSRVIKMEVVGTVKKVYSLISKFAGNSLPEPARSQVRQTLLNLPTNWTISVHKSSMSPKARRHRKRLSANGKVLILAEESLNMVKNVMDVVDCTLGRAEEWVKHKQEVKELLKQKFIHQQLKSQIREQLEKEQIEENGPR